MIVTVLPHRNHELNVLRNHYSRIRNDNIMAKYHLYLVRHGQTFLNTHHRLQGWIDSELTDKGRHQAILTGQALKNRHFDLAVSSDLHRAIQTRDLILRELLTQPNQITIDHAFREVFFSSFEGLPADLVFKKICQRVGFADQDDVIAKKGFAYMRKLVQDNDPVHQAELYSDIIERFRTGLYHITEALPNGGQVLIISHGTFIRTIADYLGINIINNFPTNGGISELSMDLPSDVRMVDYNHSLIS